MAGLVQQAQQAPAAPQAAQDPNVERIVIAAKKALAQKEIIGEVVNMMRVAGDPATGIAQATIMVMKGLYQKSNNTMPPQAIVPAGLRVLVVIAKIGESAGLFKVTPQLLQQAAAKARDLFASSAKGAQQAAPQAPAAPAAQPMGV